MKSISKKGKSFVILAIVAILLPTFGMQAVQASLAKTGSPSNSAVMDSLSKYIEAHKDKWRTELVELITSRQDAPVASQRSESLLLGNPSYFVNQITGTSGSVDYEANMRYSPDGNCAIIHAENQYDEVSIVGQMSTYSYGTLSVHCVSEHSGWRNPFKVLVMEFGVSWVDFGWETCESDTLSDYDYSTWPFRWVAIVSINYFGGDMSCCMGIDSIGTDAQQSTTHTLTVDHPPGFTPQTYIDNEYVGDGDVQVTAPVTDHSITVENPYYYGYNNWWFGGFYFDNDYHYDNPSTIYLSTDKTVTVLYS
jgi:hypothetical protein